MLRSVFVMPVASSTLPCLGVARPGRRFSPPNATSFPPVEIVELIDEHDELGDDEMTRTTGTVVCGYRIGPLFARGGLSVLFEV
ncbi:hypothetical protein, partial [Escherichia coli]|uniref:hypothetical protein n=1 Tax=Escherichia coli TaxID=562 RepID=UPI00159BA412